MENMKVVYVPVGSLTPATYYPRKQSEAQTQALRESITRFGLVNPIVVNSAPDRMNIIIGGYFRLKVAKDLGFTEMPAVYVNIPDVEKEKELSLRLNRNVGEFDISILKNFAEEFLVDIGFTTSELDDIFAIDPTPEKFDLKKELEKLSITEVKVQKGDMYEVGKFLRLRCGDSTIEEDVLALMGNEKADMCFTDEPYLLDYLHGKKKNGKATTGFGLKRDRRYLETESLPDNFVELWMGNIAKVQKPDFSIIAFEHPKNLRALWNVLEKHWKYRNTVVWHLPNRVQGFAAKYKLFNKFDIAIVGTSGDVSLNTEPEHDPLLQEEYQTALLATSGKPHWEGYQKGKNCPTDFVEFIAADEKSSGQSIIFGTKPIEILIPYIKILTKRDDLVIEPFGGSGSTGVACYKLRRRCFTMEKSPVYAEVILNRWEKLTGEKAKKIN